MSGDDVCIFMSNTIDFNQMCNPVYWTISLDFKLYILSFGTFYVLARNTRIGLLVMIFQFFLGTIWHYYYLYSNEINPPFTVTNITPGSFINMFNDIYFETSGYISSYVIGMALGVTVLTVKKREKVNKLFVLIGFLGNIATQYVFTHVYDQETMKTSLSRQQLLSIAVFVRPIYMATYTLLFYSLFMTSNYVINLSKKMIFTLASRFSFSVFLIHPFFLTFTTAFRTNDEDFSEVTQIMKILLVLISSIITEYFIMVTVEYPFDNMTKKFFESKTLSKENNNNKEE